LVDESIAAKQEDLYIRSVCFSPDGVYLATGAEDRIIRVWDIVRGRVKLKLTGHEQDIYSLDWTRDGKFIVSGSGDRTVKVRAINVGLGCGKWEISSYIVKR
jgi:general transcriptional corepressor TUP1